MKPRLAPWLTILIALIAATVGLGFLLHGQGSSTLANVVLGVGQTLTYLWIARGLFLWRHVGWVSKTARLIVFTMISAFLVVMSEALGSRSASITFLGVWGMATAFMLGLELLRLFLSGGWAVFGVARTLLDEAIRMKMALIFVVMLVLIVPFLPATLGGETRLQYRLESFLTYSLTVIATLLSVMTILLAVRTVTSELGEKQAFLTLTKPISRPAYLAGKWVGIMALNALLLLVSGIGVYSFVKVLERQPAMDFADAVAVQEQVLTARSSAEPGPAVPGALAIDFDQKLQEMRQRGADPVLYGQLGDPDTFVNPAMRQAMQLDMMKQWLTIPPRNRQTYRFSGLTAAKEAGPSVQLRFKPKAGRAEADNMVRMAFRVNDRPFADARSGQPLPLVRNNTFHTAYILSEEIRDDGTLDLTIINTGGDTQQTAITFKPGEGMEVFYKVGSFRGNLAKGMLVMWVRLGFLAALGLAAATFLGFPVACLLCFLVFFAAVGSDYLGESLRNYASIPRDEVPWWDKIWLTVGKFAGHIKEGEVYNAFKLVIRVIGEGFTFIVPPMARYSPTPLIAYGRSVEPSMIWGVFVRIGVVSTGVVAVAASYFFSRREVAQVQV
ncbi:MAG: ABC transporter permease [Planctomycetota bacterium]